VRKFLLLLACLVFLAACGGNVSEAEVYEPEVYEPEIYEPEVYAPETRDFSGDAGFLVEMVEAIHPIFLMPGKLPENYEQVRAEFLNYTQMPITRNAFTLAAMRFMAVLPDSHSGIFLARAELQFIAEPFKARDSRLFLLNEPYMEVISIGGIDVREIFDIVDRHHIVENDIQRMLNYGEWAGRAEFLEMAGVELFYSGDALSVELGLLYNGAEISRTAEFGRRRLILPNYDFGINHKIIDDVFLIDLRVAIDDPYVEAVAEAVYAAIESGIYKFILDLRGNEGGDIFPWIRLANAMGATSATPGRILRISEHLFRNLAGEDAEPLNLDEFGELRVIFEADPYAAENPNGIFVAVLTDNYTFSAATQIATMIVDGNHGIIVGEPSRQSPSFFAEMMPVYLPESSLSVFISTSWWGRPNQGIIGDTLYPDIWAESADALNVALEYLAMR
jgi:hypothetical protein